jgi:hypothetical protein|tara:strand:+ start:97 stop:426 length:330 start_codon:yes stop_codon:yes gene_type:complete
MKRDLSKPLAPSYGDPKPKVRKRSTNPEKGTSTKSGRHRSTTFSSPGGGRPAKKTVHITRVKRNKLGNVITSKSKLKGISQKRFKKASERIAVGEARDKFKEKKKSIKK